MANLPPLGNYPLNTIPSNQLLPGCQPPRQNYTAQPTPPPNSSYTIKQPYNSNSPQLGVPAQTGLTHTNNLDPHSSNNSPAFNRTGIPPTPSPHFMNPHRTLLQQPGSQNHMIPLVSAPSVGQSTSGAIPSSSSSFNQYPTSATIGNPGIRPTQPWLSAPVSNAPSSQPMQNYLTGTSLTNGPLANPSLSALPQTSIGSGMASSLSQYGAPLSSAGMNGQYSLPPTSQPLLTGQNTTFPGPQLQPQPRNMHQGVHSVSLKPAMQPPLTSRAPLHTADPINQPGPTKETLTGTQLGTTSKALPSGFQVPPIGSTAGSQQRPPMANQLQTSAAVSQAAPLNGSFLNQQLQHQDHPSGQALRLQSELTQAQNGLPSGRADAQGLPTGPQLLSGSQAFQGPPSRYQPGHPSGPPVGPPSGPSNAFAPGTQSSMNARYPNTQQPGYNQNQYQQFNGPRQTQNLTNQMGQMSVAQQGFNQMWGQQMFDLLQTRHILPEYPDEPQEVKLGHQFAESVNCSPEIFRCTINRIPETNSLLQKSRLPLGILIHPFKDLDHLPVIQCQAIVRCRSCRTYINPFVYFVDSKRWKCNLCYRVNDLPEEFQYDPVSKSYGDPTRRPEVKSATIEFIAPGEYMLRPPQPAVYLFLLDVSDMACDSGYLQVFCETLKNNLEQLPGDARTQVGFVCYDANVHFYLLGEGLTRPREMTVIDIDDIFLPSPEWLLVNLGERREMICDLLDSIPKRHVEQKPRLRASALGAALQAAFKLMAPTGGRVTVMQTCLPNVGPGALTSREDPNARSSKDVAHLNPATDFYKRLALECSGAQVAVDLFLASSQYSDLATLSGISKFSGGTVHYVPIFNASRPWQADQLRRMLARYLTRKIGFEAVMRVRCTRGIAIHTFHGNFFVRSTDLLSLPNVSPDAGFGMQLTIEESLSDLQQVCFQAALLYTSSKGERRIRVHTLCLPVANNLTDVMHSADQLCIVGLLTKMAVDRAQQSSLSDAREALSNVAVDTLSAHRLAQNLPSGVGASLTAPACLRLLCLYLSATLKHPAFRVGTSTRLDDRVYAMCEMKSQPLSQLLRSVYPDLYAIHNLHEHVPAPAETTDDEDAYPDPPRLQLSAERINFNGAYLLDDGTQMIIYVCSGVSPAYLLDTFGVSSYHEVADEARELPQLESSGNALLHSFVEKLNDERPYAANILVLRDNSPSRKSFTDRLVDDRVEGTFSYYEFLQHVRTQMK